MRVDYQFTLHKQVVVRSGPKNLTSVVYFFMCFPMGGEIIKDLGSTLICDAILCLSASKSYIQNEANLLTTLHTDNYARYALH